MAHWPLGSDRLRPGVWPARLRLALPALAPSTLWQQLLVRLLEERERWFLWLPVGVGIGIALYFALPIEPPPWLGPLALLPPVLAACRQWWRGEALWATSGLPCLVALTTLGAGFTATQVRTHLVAAPVLEQRDAYVVEGRVLLVEDRVQGQRLLLGRPTIDGLAPEATPAQVRFTVRNAPPALQPGDVVRGRAVLMPPSPPAAPGDFDFARRAFFERLGAVGFALGDVELVARVAEQTLGSMITGARQHVAQRVADAVPGTPGAVAVALLTGLRGAIPDHVWLDMQASGLAHLLAISGLHLGLVAGTLFFAARIGIALLPPLALRLPGKKVAAAVALAGAFGYLLLSGGPVPTQRAFIMTAFMLIAVMVDRNPFSMRLVALAALAVLLLQPESLLGASFQMSFAAVVALIAAYETGAGRRPAGATGLDWRLLMYVAGVALTTILASLATSPFAIYHFGRLPTYGIAANLIAVPLTAFWIMPLGLLGLLLVPLGVGATCFALMGDGIELLLAVAARVASWPGAALRVAELPEGALVATVLGGLWLCLWRGRWRRLGLLALPLAFLLALLYRPPDLLIERRGQIVAARGADGRLAISPWERDDWITGGWLRRFGQEEAAPWPEPGALADARLRCDALGCVLSGSSRRVALARRPEALEADCREADLVIAYPRIEYCPTGGAPLIGPEALWDSRGLALWLQRDGIRILSVREDRGDRPWAR